MEEISFRIEIAMITIGVFYVIRALWKSRIHDGDLYIEIDGLGIFGIVAGILGVFLMVLS